MKRARYGIVLLLAAALLLGGGPALAETPSAPLGAYVEAVTEENAFGAVAYPQLAGYSEAAVQAAVNKAIYEKAGIESHLSTLGGLAAGGWGLKVDYKHTLKNDVLSVLVSAYGEMPGGRMGQTYTGVSYSLDSGKPITLADLFTDVEGAFALMEQKLEEEVGPQLSGYLENDTLAPIPRDNFFLTETGITFYYPHNQFSMLSGYSGGANFLYYELEEYLLLSEGSVLDRLGAADVMGITGGTARQVEEAIAAGSLPGMAFRLGDDLMPVLAEYRLLVEPDYYPGGRFFEVEAPELRSAWLLTDALTDAYDHSQVLGVRADRMNLFGIRTGITTLEEWREALGQPENIAELNDYTAEDYRLPAGTSDYYTFGSNRLRLHADEEGVLRSVQLLK